MYSLPSLYEQTRAWGHISADKRFLTPVIQQQWAKKLKALQTEDYWKH